MLLLFSTPVLIGYLCQLKTVVFLHWCLIHALLLFYNYEALNFKSKQGYPLALGQKRKSLFFSKPQLPWT